MDSPQFDFATSLRKLQDKIRRVLDSNRDPCLLSEVSHSYRDKFDLAQQVCTTTLTLMRKTLTLNDDDGKVQEFLNACATQDQTITLRFDANQQCQFIKEDSVTTKVGQVKSTVESVVGEVTKKTKEETYGTRIDYHWRIGLNYRMFCFTGSDPNGHYCNLMQGEVPELEVITKTKQPPAPESRTYGSFDIDLSVLKGDFTIDRSAPSCKTPVRNDEVQKLAEFCGRYRIFLQQIWGVFYSVLRIMHDDNIEPRGKRHEVREIDRQVESVFIPVMPFLNKKKPENDEDGNLTFSNKDITALLAEFDRSSKMMLQSVEETLVDVPNSNSSTNSMHSLLFNSGVCKLLSVAFLSKRVAIALEKSVKEIENQIIGQVKTALGQECTEETLNDCMIHHNSTIYNSAYVPRPFSYDVRQEGHAPEGSISFQVNDRLAYSSCSKIESAEFVIDGTDDEVLRGNPEVRFSLNPATDIEMYGQQHLHGIMFSKFSDTPLKCELIARARQFSSYVLMIGTIGSGNRFEAKQSLIVRNKDDVTIPLSSTIIPSAQEFHDSIQSLSPEQQSFAKAFREMQLHSTVMAIAVIPIRPLLERLLNIPPGSLTKEIKLTQDLTELFIEYQIPSDLLSFVGDPGQGSDMIVNEVKGHVKAILDMIEAAREKELKRRKQERDEAKYRNRAPQPQQQNRSPAMLQLSKQRRCAATPNKVGRLMEVQVLSCEADNGIADFSMEADGNVKAMEVEATFDSDGKETSTATNELKELCLHQSSRYADLPKLLEKRFQDISVDSSIRPVILKVSDYWMRKRKPGLIAKAESEGLNVGKLRTEHSKSMDLLDALTRSGELSLQETTVHIVVAVANCFDSTLLNTVVQENVNPVEVIDQSYLVMNETIHDETADKMLKDPKSITTTASG